MKFLGKVFNGAAHVFAWVLKKGLPKAAAVAQEADAVLESPIGQAIATAIGKDAEKVQNDVHAAAGALIAVRDTMGEAFAAKAADFGLDAKAIEAVEALWQLSTGLINGKPPAPASVQS